VRNGLLAEIRRKIDNLDRHLSPRHILKKNKIIKTEILKAAQYQSFKIENPHIGSTYSVPRNHNRSSIKRGIKNIENAFRFGQRVFSSGTIDEDLIKGIAGRILPDVYLGEPASYRTSEVRIVGAQTSPPDPYRVRGTEMPWLMDNLNRKLSSPDKIDQILAAFFAHYHLVRIHPFVDGNGRTSRTLQDVILNKNMIPPPIVESGERYTYFDFLDKADIGWKSQNSVLRSEFNGVTSGEQDFYTFMAGKLNASLDKVIYSISNQR